MRILALLGVSTAIAFTLGMAGPRAAGCDPAGDIQFVCGSPGPEDLTLLPGSEWVLATSYTPGGALRLISVRDKTAAIAFPTATPGERLDAKTYASCPGPMDPAEKEKQRTHGLALRPGKNSIHTLYVVHHGLRESIEVFEIDGRAKTPVLTWIGCAVAPEKTSLNSVVALPDGGFAATNFQTTGGGKWQAGEKSGEVWEWHPAAGWKVVPGSEASGPNGLEISKDGKWFYVGGSGSHSVIRLSRGQTPVKKDEVSVGFVADNLRWTPDGSLLVAGGGGPDPKVTIHIDKIDPKTLQVRQLIRHASSDLFSNATVAIQVGKEIWVGSILRDRVARFPMPQSK